MSFVISPWNMLTHEYTNVSINGFLSFIVRSRKHSNRLRLCLELVLDELQDVVGTLISWGRKSGIRWRSLGRFHCMLLFILTKSLYSIEENARGLFFIKSSIVCAFSTRSRSSTMSDSSSLLSRMDDIPAMKLANSKNLVPLGRHQRSYLIKCIYQF